MRPHNCVIGTIPAIRCARESQIGPFMFSWEVIFEILARCLRQMISVQIRDNDEVLTDLGARPNSWLFYALRMWCSCGWWIWLAIEVSDRRFGRGNWRNWYLPHEYISLEPMVGVLHVSVRKVDGRRTRKRRQVGDNVDFDVYLPF